MENHSKLKLLIFVLLLYFSIIGAAQSLKIYCIDVDQGDATFIVTPGQQSILIDCGEAETADHVINIIKNVANLSTIDYFVCTHYHDDHYGALDELDKSNIKINKRFYDRDSQNYLSNRRKNSYNYKNYVRVAENKRRYLRPGRKIDVDNDVKVECFVVNGRAKQEYGSIDYPEKENGYSIGLLITYKNFDFLIAGDLTKDVESKLVDRGVLQDVDVYHVSHHGSTSSSSLKFLEKILPEVSIISSGSVNGYNHPKKTIINRIKGLASYKAIYQLNKNTYESSNPNVIGSVSAEFLGDVDCDGDEGTLLIEVKNGKYTIEYINRDDLQPVKYDISD